MGASDSQPVVLVPPLFERDLRLRSRLAHSSYDFMFAKPALRFLFEDYLLPLGRGWLNLRPAEDPRISVSALFDAPLQDPRSSTGLVTLRYQPDPEDYSTFIDVKAAAEAGGVAQARGCIFNPSSGFGAWGSLPLLRPAGEATNSKQRAHVGLRYSTASVTAGAVVSLEDTTLEQLWLGARRGGFQVGAQCTPNQPLSSLHKAGGGQDLLDHYAHHTSYTMAYSPEGVVATPGRGTFTAAVEVKEQQQMVVSFLYHMALQRNIRNPFERVGTIAVTNYLDVGLKVATDVVSSGNGSSPPAAPAAALAVAWQINKNLLAKAKVATDSVGAAVAFKSWWHPSWTAAATASWMFASRSPKFGISFGCENHGNIRYERSSESVITGSAITQRHYAQARDLANAEGEGILVTPNEFGSKSILGQVPKAADKCL